MGRRKARPTWDDTGTYEMEEVISHFMDAIVKMETKWGSGKVRERVGHFGYFLWTACSKPYTKEGTAPSPEREENDGE